MTSQLCFECDAPATTRHHVVPQARGGTRTVWLCDVCHGKAHHRDGAMRTGELTRAALRARRAAGVVYNHALLGYDIIDGKMVVNPTEMATVAEVCRLAAEGLSLRAICAAMMAGGFATKRGGRWAPSTIQRILASRAILKKPARPMPRSLKMREPRGQTSLWQDAR